LVGERGDSRRIDFGISWKEGPPKGYRKIFLPLAGVSAKVIWAEQCEKGEEKKEDNVKEKGGKTDDKREIEVRRVNKCRAGKIKSKRVCK
jgi:hypothetical protein